jgi:hypothetical protein
MERRGASYGLLLLLGAGALANGLVMLLAPEPWFARIAASTGVFNAHLVRDVGGAYAASGIAALWAARSPQWRAPLAATAALFHGMHAAIHAFEVANGRQPMFHLLEDLPGVYFPTAALLVIALCALRRSAPAEIG